MRPSARKLGKVVHAHNLITYPIKAIRDFSESVKEFVPGSLACNSQTNLGRQCSDICRKICSRSSSNSSEKIEEEKNQFNNSAKIRFIVTQPFISFSV